MKCLKPSSVFLWGFQTLMLPLKCRRLFCPSFYPVQIFPENLSIVFFEEILLTREALVRGIISSEEVK